jgi:type IV pilus assembly protein PilE
MPPRAGRVFVRETALGFTLLELMLVLAVLAILVAIALPSYQQSVRRSSRADAKAILMETAQAMERVFTTNNSYATGTVISAVSPKGASGTDKKYDIGFKAGEPTATTFVLEAVPANSQIGDSCGTLTLSNTGAQTPSTAGCW